MKKYILIPIIVIFLIVAFIVSYNKPTNEFIIDNDTKLNTKIINSYTIKSNGMSYTYKIGNEQFNDINIIFEKAELYHDRSRLYLYDEEEANNTEQIILNNDFVMYVYIGDLSIDNTATVIIKDYCKGKNTNYLLDNHDYLIAKLTKEEYYKIFKC